MGGWTISYTKYGIRALGFKCQQCFCWFCDLGALGVFLNPLSPKYLAELNENYVK